MKILEVTLTLRTPEGTFIQGDRVEADDLVQLLAQFMLVIGNVHRTMMNETRKEIIDDDIPF